MDQSILKNYISRFLKGDLTKEEEIRLLEWIKLSPENKKQFFMLQNSLAEELTNRSDETIKPEREELLQRIKLIQTSLHPLVRSRMKYYCKSVSMAAAFIIGFVVGIIVLSKEEKPLLISSINQNISVPYGAHTNFILPDSTVVWLNSGSQLTFPSYFEGERVVNLTGEAYFEVKKSKTPFVVSTLFGKVEAKGTSFNVKAYPNDFFETTLITGNLEVIPYAEKKITLHSGYQALFTGKEFKIEEIDPELYTSWTKGKLIFRKAYLPEMVKQLERWYNVKIELDNDPRLKEIYYTATIEMESFSEVLALIKSTGSIYYEWNKKNRSVKFFYDEKE